MVDIHAHVLPGIDDGAADLYDTLEMAQIAVASGISAMVSTPHCNIPGLYDNYYGELYNELFIKVESMLVKEKIPLTLYAGMEVFLTPNVPELLRQGKLLTINGGHYILVECSFEEDPVYVDGMLREIKALGLVPVIAHPERYEFVKDNIQLIYKWRKMGCEVQVNKGSLQGRFGRQSFFVAHELLEHNLVSVVASDAHSPYQRTPNMSDVYEELSRHYPQEYLDILFRDNPLRICRDQKTYRFDLRPFEAEW